MAFSNPVIAGGLTFGSILIFLVIVDFLLLKLTIHNAISGFIKRLTGIGVNGRMLALCFLIVGVILFGGFTAAWSGTFGGLFKTASITDGDGIPDATVSDCTIAKARYSLLSGGEEMESNATFIADETDPSNYFIDTYNLSVDALSGTETTDGVDLNGTLTLWVAETPATGQECNALIYIVGPNYKTQVETSGANADVIYSLIEESGSVSDLAGVKGTNRVEAIDFTNTVYLNDGSIASTSSDKEITAVQFAAGEMKNTLGFAMELDVTAYNNIKKNNQVEFQFRQQVGSKPSTSDPVIYTLTLRKGVKG